MYVSKALGFWCDDGPCWSWSWKSATETSMLRMLCKSSCTNFGSAGPHSKAKQTRQIWENLTLSTHIYIYITGVFFLDPKAFHYCFLAWLHTISTYKKNIKGRKLYYTPTTHESLWQGDFRAQSCSGRTMLELVNDISPNCLEIPGGKTPSFRKWNNQHRFCIYPKHIKYDVMVLRSYFWSTNRWLKVIFCLPAIRSLSRFYSYNSCISCQVKITNQTCFCSSLLLDCFQ